VGMCRQWATRIHAGVNFAPLKSNFADLRREDYEKRLRQYQDLGVNTFRINACQFLEREWFYDLCDELGLMVWQEFPSLPQGRKLAPEDETAIAEMAGTRPILHHPAPSSCLVGSVEWQQ